MVATQRKLRLRLKKIPRNPARRANSPQPPRAVEHFLALAYRRAVARVGRALWQTLEPLLPSLAKTEPETKLDAPPADGSIPDAIAAARAVVKKHLNGVEADVEAASKRAAKRADIHAKRELARIGIKLSDADSGVAKMVPRWRKENVARITGMVEDQLGKIERILEEGEGHYADTLAKEIKRQCLDVSDSRAEFIARDQVLTLNAQITKQRQLDVGIKQFVWTTSQDERVRPEHQALEGRTFDWDDPDTNGEGVPGEAPLCRCTAYPILPELSDQGE